MKLAFKDHLALRAVSSHVLMALADHGPAECYRQYFAGQRTESGTSAMQFGTLVHCLALTPRLFDREFLVADYERRSNAGKAHHALLAATGKTVIKPTDFGRARAIVAALKRDPETWRLLRKGEKERSLVRPRLGGLLPLKARIDVHDASCRRVVDLKTTRDIEGVSRAMRQYHYYLQGAFYAHMARALDMLFVFVQTVEPHYVTVVEMNARRLREGEDQWRAALEQFDDCWRENHWPEKAPPMDDDPLMMPLPEDGPRPKTYTLEL